MAKKSGLTLERHEEIERQLGDMHAMTIEILHDAYLAYPVNGRECRGLEKVQRSIEEAKARMQTSKWMEWE